jgi:hypothetical protein
MHEVYFGIRSPLRYLLALFSSSRTLPPSRNDPEHERTELSEKRERRELYTR